MQAFDLSGTLVNIDYNADQLITAIYDAKMIYLPIGPFVIITTQKPDADKLARAIGDALTIAGVIRDDSYIIEWNIRKSFDDNHPAGVEITVL